VQFIELLGTLFLVGVVLLFVVPVVADPDSAPHSALRIGVGLGAGLVGAMIVLVLRTDLVPDELESILRVPLLVLVIVVFFLVILRARRGKRG
jgi:hypothetical protein